MFEANSIIKYIGLGLIGIGYYYFIGSIKLEQYEIFCFSISAFLFVLSDFFDLKILENEGKKIKKKKWITFWGYCKSSSLLLAILFVTLFPYFHPNFTEEFINKLSNTSLLIGLGLTILLIGYRSDRKTLEFLNSIAKELEKTYRRLK
jgi:hypothetical protein